MTRIILLEIDTSIEIAEIHRLTPIIICSVKILILLCCSEIKFFFTLTPLIVLFFSCSKSSDKKRKHTPSNLPDGSGLGDHIQLLQIFELWHETDYNIGWCKENNLQVLAFDFFYLFCFVFCEYPLLQVCSLEILGEINKKSIQEMLNKLFHNYFNSLIQVRGMKFVKDVRKQLCQIIQKIAKGQYHTYVIDLSNLFKLLCIIICFSSEVKTEACTEYMIKLVNRVRLLHLHLNHN